MLRQFLIVSAALTLIWTSVGCTNPAAYQQPYATPSPPVSESIPAASQTSLSDGQYPVQQATYDDAIGEYSIMLLNTRPGEPSMFRITNLPMARLTDEEIESGQKSYLKVENGQPSLHLTEDFRIEYIHNVTELQTDPQTGQQEVVIVRQEPSFWTPFAGALAGQALGSLLFRPHYYVPPLYRPGVPLVGFGGYGTTYSQAVNRYQSRYQAPPAEVRNRQAFRTTGQLRSPTSGQSRIQNSRQTTGDRATGRGYGSSKLRGSGQSGETYRRPSRSSGARTRSFRRGRR